MLVYLTFLNLCYLVHLFENTALSNVYVNKEGILW